MQAGKRVRCRRKAKRRGSLSAVPPAAENRRLPPLFRKREHPYRAMRSKAEIEAADLGYPQIAALSLHRCQGDLCGELSSLSRLAMVLSAPRTARLQRLRQWSYDRFGARMLEGGDLYAQEEAFFRFAAERSPLDAVSWLDALSSVRSCASTGAGTAAVLSLRSLRILRKSFLYPAANQKASRLSSREAFLLIYPHRKDGPLRKKLLLFIDFVPSLSVISGGTAAADDFRLYSFTGNASASGET